MVGVAPGHLDDSRLHDILMIHSSFFIGNVMKIVLRYRSPSLWGPKFSCGIMHVTVEEVEFTALVGCFVLNKEGFGVDCRLLGGLL